MSFPVSLQNLVFDCQQNGWVDSNLISSYAKTYPEVPFPTAVSSLPPIVVDPMSTNLLGLTVYSSGSLFSEGGKNVTVSVATYKLNSLGIQGDKLAIAPGIITSGSIVPGIRTGVSYKNVDISSAFFMRDSSSINPGPGTTRDVALYIKITENASNQRILKLPPLTCRVLFSSEL